MKGFFKKLMRPLPAAMILAALLRIVLSRTLGSTFLSHEVCDDVLMLSYSALRSHFLEPQIYSMAKTMVFPLFLDVVHVSHVSYNIWLSLLYIAASLTLFYAVKRVFKSRALAAFAYFYFLFIPLAFDWWSGLRIYRNAIIPPFVTAFFSLSVLAVWRAWFPEDAEAAGNGKRRGLKNVFFYLLLGLVMTLTYYIREDGIWILACLLVFLGFAFIGTLVKGWKRIGKGKTLLRAGTVLLPLVLFVLCTHVYKSVNQHFFGVYGIETRTAGEQGGFVQRLFRIDSPERTSEIWTPADVIDKAFEASPTLRSAEGYRDAIIQSEVAKGDMYAHPITGERMGWLTKDALLSSGNFVDEPTSEAFFRQVNLELDEAFADGTLKEADRIQLLSSSGGFTKEEILDLAREMEYGFRGTVLEQGYYIGAQPPNLDERLKAKEVSDFAAFVTREPSIADYETRYLTKAQETLNKVLNGWFPAFGVMNAVLFGLGLIAAVWAFIRLFRKGKKDLTRELFDWLGTCAFFGIGTVYLFGISWYSHFIWGSGPVNTEIFNFYLIALPCIWMFCYLFGLRTLAGILRGILDRRAAKQEAKNAPAPREEMPEGSARGEENA